MYRKVFTGFEKGYSKIITFKFTFLFAAVITRMRGSSSLPSSEVRWVRIKDTACDQYGHIGNTEVAV